MGKSKLNKEGSSVIPTTVASSSDIQRSDPCPAQLLRQEEKVSSKVMDTSGEPSFLKDTNHAFSVQVPSKVAFSSIFEELNNAEGTEVPEHLWSSKIVLEQTEKAHSEVGEASGLCKESEVDKCGK